MRLKDTLPAVAASLFLAAQAFAVSVRWPTEAVTLNVQFDTTAHTISGTAVLTLSDRGDKTVGFILNKSFTVQSATAEGEPLELKKSDQFDTTAVSSAYGFYGKWDPSKASFYSAKLGKKGLRARKHVSIEVAFTGKLYAPPDNRQFSREKIAFEVDGTIGSEGIYLSPSSFWYPILPDCQTPYIVTARVPKGWNCVTDGAASAPKDVGNFTEVTHTADFPVTGVSFSAGPFIVKSVQQDGSTISTYFLTAEAALADGYLESCKKFIAMYSKLIGPYPFRKFAVVDNFMPSGYGMPGWTLLGSEVIKLPFIKDTSLGHEILHNWFGNGILVDYHGGNWCEGLTSYMADYKYKEDADSLSAVEYRRNLLAEYADFVHKDNDYPLANFSERSNQADRAIGYGKCAMVFHMMRRMVNQEDSTQFIQMLQYMFKEFKGKPVSWLNWRQQFEKRAGQKVDWFFDQWVNRTGLPSITIESGHLETVEGSWTAQLVVKTDPSTPVPFNFFLKFRCITDEGFIDYEVFIREPEQKIELAGPGVLQAIKADPGYDLIRVIYPSETPLTFGTFFGDKDGVLVIPSKGKHIEAYKAAAEGLKNEGQTVITDDKYTPDMAKRSLWIFGLPDENSAWNAAPPDSADVRFLPGKVPRWKEEKAIPPALVFRGEELRGGAWTGTLLQPRKGVEGKCVVWTVCTPDADPVAGTRKLPHYGKYSYLLFDGDTNKSKGVWAASGASPMVWIPSKTGEIEK